MSHHYSSTSLQECAAEGRQSSHSDVGMEHCSAGCGFQNCDGSDMHNCDGSGMQGRDSGGMHVREAGGGMHEGGGMSYLDLGRSIWELQESALHQLAEVAEKKKQQVYVKTTFKSCLRTAQR